MAQLGVTTAMVSLVLSAFMVGLGIGSWAAGLIVRRYGPKFPALKLYALVELLIGVSAFAVPIELAWGREVLLKNFPAMSLSTSTFPRPSGWRSRWSRGAPAWVRHSRS